MQTRSVTTTAETRIGIKERERREEVREMREVCYCGRTSELEDRMPVVTGDGARALACPACGHEDRLEWLPEHTRMLVMEGAKRKRDRIAAA
jgi:hypothetical protein